MVRKRRRGDNSIIEREAGLGEFINFSDIIHGMSIISFRCPLQKMQGAVIEAMLNLNGREEQRLVSLSALPIEAKGIMSFEIGLANGIFFDYLDKPIANNIKEYLSLNSNHRNLDFLLVATYHYNLNGKYLPLKFDHHQIRFFFNTGKIEVLLHHAQGTRRLPLDELLQIIFDEIKRIVKRERLGEIKVETTKTL